MTRKPLLVPTNPLFGLEGCDKSWDSTFTPFSFYALGKGGGGGGSVQDGRCFGLDTGVEEVPLLNVARRRERNLPCDGRVDRIVLAFAQSARHFSPGEEKEKPVGFSFLLTAENIF